MEKVSLIITIKNEEHTILQLLQSLEAQTCLPDEVVIVDGGSTDRTYELLSRWRPPFPLVLKKKVGNRSVGRNYAIEIAKHAIIAITDAGCVLDNNWLKYLLEPFSLGALVVAGFYASLAETPFKKAAAAYMLVMPNKVDEHHFLPATRSMAVKKSVWKEIGGFGNAFQFSEDYVFARKLRENNIPIVFQKKAVVFWLPPSNWQQFFTQVFHIAHGDTFAGILRPKVALIFLRYAFFFMFIMFSPPAFFYLFLLYLFWAVKKNFQYVWHISALYILPLMQLGTDIIVMFASLVGTYDKITRKTHD